MKMMRLRSMKKLTKSTSKVGNNGGNCCCKNAGEIKWEVRPGGMLVQKREDFTDGGNVVRRVEGKEGMIIIRVSTTFATTIHDIPIQPTSTFGELKRKLAMVTSMAEREQRLLFKGKEREDEEHLHMVGVRDKDKVLLLQDPAIKASAIPAFVPQSPSELNPFRYVNEFPLFRG